MSACDEIESLLHPVGVALIGGLDRRGDPERFLSAQRTLWGSAFFLVDPAGGTIGGVTVHASVRDVTEPVDVAVISIPPAAILETVDECGERGIRSLIVCSSGFGETGDEGAAIERELVARARAHGMRVLGPNANTNLYIAMAPPVSPRIGKIGLVTQSGHLGRVVFQSSPHGVAISRWIPTGNEADLETADFIEYFAHDPDTAVIAGYFESFRDGAKLRHALAVAAAERTPIVAIKVGRQEASSRMASSHTGQLIGSDAALDGLFKQYGVIRVDDIDELIETAALLAKIRPQPRRETVGLYGISGGALTLMAEQAEAHAVTVPELSAETRARLHRVLPSHLSVGNPVDPGVLYRSAGPAERMEVLEAICADDAVGVVVCALPGILPVVTEAFAADIVALSEVSEKPVVVTWNTWELGSPAYTALVESGIPIFRTFRNCFAALRAYFDHLRRVEAARSRPVDIAAAGPRTGSERGLRTLGPSESLELLARYGVPLAEERIASSPAEAAALAGELGFPAVAKVFLADWPHKSDVSLLRVGLDSADAVAAATEEIQARARELAPGVETVPVVVQRQLEPGVEMIVGAVRDDLVGAVVVVGLGGVLAETLEDVSVRPLPISESDAYAMIDELQGRKLLAGTRAAPAGDVDALARVVLAVAALAGDPANEVVEIDLNPVIVGPSSAVAVDRLIVVEA